MWLAEVCLCIVSLSLGTADPKVGIFRDEVVLNDVKVLINRVRHLLDEVEDVVLDFNSLQQDIFLHGLLGA
jgi:hypothetical protein